MAIIGMHPALDKLQKSDYDFHLVGSRFLGIAAADADYDFMIKITGGSESRRIVKWLKSLGFVAQTTGGYTKDSRLVGIYKWRATKPLQPGEYPEIDILLADEKEFNRRMATFELLQKKLHPHGKGAYSKPDLGVTSLVRGLKQATSSWQGLFDLVGTFQEEKAQAWEDGRQADDAGVTSNPHKSSEDEDEEDEEDEDNYGFGSSSYKMPEKQFEYQNDDFNF